MRANPGSRADSLPYRHPPREKKKPQRGFVYNSLSIIFMRLAKIEVHLFTLSYCKLKKYLQKIEQMAWSQLFSNQDVQPILYTVTTVAYQHKLEQF